MNIMADAALNSATPATDTPDPGLAPSSAPPGELDVKLEKLRALLESRSLGALLLRRVPNFAWATCGATTHLNVADAFGQASLLITPGGRYLITDNTDAKRLKEELHLEEQGWELQVAPWYEQDGLLE